MSVESKFLWTVSVDGIGALGKFDSRTGGEPDVTVTKHRPGGMGPEQTYMSLPAFSDLSLSRVYKSADVALVAQLTQLSGRAKATVTEQPLDDSGTAYGAPTTWKGRLGAIKRGNGDSTSNAVRMWSLDVSVETQSN